MFIYTAKLSKRMITVVLLAALLLILLVILLANRNTGTAIETANLKLSSPEEQVRFLSSCGYTVSPEPVTTREVQIPKEFTEVYTRYNAMQKAQGFDLEKFRGKQATQYVFEVMDYAEDDDPEPVYATLLLYKNKLIAAELSRGGENGFLRPLMES